MYSYEDRLRTAMLYPRHERDRSATLRQLGYYNNNSLKVWRVDLSYPFARRAIHVSRSRRSGHRQVRLEPWTSIGRASRLTLVFSRVCTRACSPLFVRRRDSTESGSTWFGNLVFLE